MLVVGLTGGIASGKTCAASYLRQTYQIPLIDADVVAREVVHPKTPTYQAIVAYLGQDYCLADGQLDRQKIRQLIFHNPEKKKSYEALILPAIREQLRLSIEALPVEHPQAAYALVVAPLLFESRLSEKMDKTIVIDSEESTQVERGIERWQSPVKVSPDTRMLVAESRDALQQTLQAIIDSQLSRKARCALADFVINNDGSLAQLYQQLDVLHQQLLVLANKQPHSL